MAVKIRGTGNAANPSITGDDDDTGLVYGTNQIDFSTGGTTRATVDSFGNLNIPDNGKIQLGTGNDLNILHTGSASEINNTTNTELQIKNLGNNGILLKNENAYPIIFQTSATERMRIDSSGRVGIGTNSPDYLFNVVKGGVDMCRFQQTTDNQSDGYECILMKHAAATSGQNGIGLRFQNSGGTTVGKIDFGQSTTQYRTSSDYRLKENAVAISDGITRLKTLKPYQFNWIAEKGQPKVDGFFAHEVTAVPEAISGAKDEVDSDNKPLYQSIDHSKLVPLLTAALQEAITKIETLETKVAALEAG